MADIFTFPSFREGLSVALMKAMASGLSVVCSNTRGNIGLVENNVKGYWVTPDDIDNYVVNIKRLYEDRTVVEIIGKI